MTTWSPCTASPPPSIALFVFFNWLVSTGLVPRQLQNARTLEAAAWHAPDPISIKQPCTVLLLRSLALVHTMAAPPPE